MNASAYISERERGLSAALTHRCFPSSLVLNIDHCEPSVGGAAHEVAGRAHNKIAHAPYSRRIERVRSLCEINLKSRNPARVHSLWQILV